MHGAMDGKLSNVSQCKMNLTLKYSLVEQTEKSALAQSMVNHETILLFCTIDEFLLLLIPNPKPKVTVK